MAEDPLDNPTLIQRLLIWPAKRPVWTLVIVAVIVTAGAVSASRLTPVPSLRPMFASDDPAAQAMLRLLDDYEIGDDLLILVRMPEANHGPAKSNSAAAKQQLLGFARRLKTAINQDEQASAMSTGISYRRGAGLRRFFREQIVPAGVYYLTDPELAKLKQRLRPEAITTQIQRNEALLSSASPSSDMISRRILQDPLRLHELLARSINPPTEQNTDAQGSQEPRKGQAQQAGKKPNTRNGNGNGNGNSNSGGVPFGSGGAVGDNGAMFTNPIAAGEANQASRAPPMIGADGRSLLIRVHGRQAAGELDFTRRFMPVMRRMVDQANSPSLRVDYSGAYPIAELSARVIKSDMIRSVIISIFILQGLFLLAYRWLLSFPLTFVPVNVGIVTGFGVFAILWPRLTPVTASSGAILAGLGVDYCIHYLSHYLSRRRSEPANALAARTSVQIGPPLGGACVTSLIGFLAVGVSSVPALRDFALIGALGLGGVFLASLTILPAALSLIDRRANRPAPSHGPSTPSPVRAGVGESPAGSQNPAPAAGPSGKCSRRFGRLLPGADSKFGQAKPPLRFHLDGVMWWISRHRTGSILATTLVIVAAAAVIGIGGIVGLESDPSVLQPRPSPPMQTRQQIGQLFPSARESVPVLLEGGTPRDLAIKAHQARQALNATPLVKQGVIRLLGLGTLVPDPRGLAKRQAAVRQIDPQRVIGDFRDALRSSAFDPAVYDAYIAFLRQALDDPRPPTVSTLRKYPKLGKTLLPTSAFTQPDRPITQGLMLISPQREIDDPLERQAMFASVRNTLGKVPGATPTGDELVRIDIEQTIRRDLKLLLSVAAVAVVGWLFVLFRRPRQVLLTVVPPMVCLLIVFAVMRLTGQKLNILNLIALPLLTGIGVDDGIFLLSIAAKSTHREPGKSGESGESGESGLIGQMSASCHAITMTSLTTALAFGSLMFTRTPAIRSLGFVLAVGMIGCWLAAVFLLAPLLMSLEARASRRF